MASKLDHARKQAHASLMAQAQQRAHATLGTGTPNGHIDSGYNPAVFQRATGNTAQAAADWEAHHPAAVQSGHLPGWLSNFLGKQIANISPFGSGSVIDGRPPIPMAHPPDGGPATPASGGTPMGFGPSGAVHPIGPVSEGLGPTGGDVQPGPSATRVQTANPVGHAPLIPLGQGLFVHALTGEIHGPTGVVQHFPLTPMAPAPSPVAALHPAVAS